MRPSCSSFYSRGAASPLSAARRDWRNSARGIARCARPSLLPCLRRGVPSRRAWRQLGRPESGSAKEHYDRLERNKGTVTAFYDLHVQPVRATGGHRAVRRDTYIQHNPGVEDGKQGFIDYFERAAEKYPGKRVYFEKVIAEGNYVTLHCRQEWPGETSAGIDIFRLDDNGKVVEHWDVLQLVPAESKNNNGMF